MVSDQNIPDKFKNATQIDLTLCAQVKDNSIVQLISTENLLYSYLPTEETNYKFPVLVNASFLTTANRESLHIDSIWNQWLFKQIGSKLFEWIAEIVQSEYQFQAYHLLPDKIKHDSLGKAFNEAMDTALGTIAFVITKDGKLVKVKDSIVDFTFLSDKNYVGEEPIKRFLRVENNHFTTNTGFGNKLTKLGATEFNWKQVTSLFSSIYFQEYCSSNNIQLIDHFYYLYKNDDFKDLKSEEFKKIPFILDHKNALCTPPQVCFPSSDDSSWNNQSSDLSFIHEDTQIWLRGKREIKDWLESLGVLEKTDITYITQTIIPNIKRYITHNNAIQVIQDLFHLFEKGDLKKELIEQLSEIKLLTKKGQLIPANQCHLSDFYNPRFAIEEILDLDIFVSEEYCIDGDDKNEWKHFFIRLGVQQKTSFFICTDKINSTVIAENEFGINYLDSIRNEIYNGRFPYDEFKNLTYINYLHSTDGNTLFSLEFWKDFIQNNPSTTEIQQEAIAYWGYNGMDGRVNGHKVNNYLPWYVQNIDCLPTTTSSCSSSSNVFLNLPEIREIAGNYLPVFDGIELNADWRAFFKFKIEFDLEDYLSVLTQVSQDTEPDGTVKETNKKRINLIYRDLLKVCSNWGEYEKSAIQEWSKSNQLLNTENKFTECNDLKYFLDGNESIFQGQFNFISINAENKQHHAIEKLLQYLGVQILKQDDFELIPTDESDCFALKEYLENVLPYFKIWIEQDTNNDIETLRALEDLQSNIGQLKVKHALELKIQYPEIGFIKDTNTYFRKSEIYVTKPWDSNSVLMTLPTQLCGFLGLRGHDKKLDFLLRSKVNEIRKYFAQENINVPDCILNQPFCKTHESSKQIITSISTTKSSILTHNKVSSEYYHVSEADLEKYKYTQEIISRSMKNILQYLSTHTDYDCTNHYKMADSIIGGIKKNGHEITIVARPSDNNQVILYSGSEFDVLSHTDAEFWHEDGITPPRQIRVGQLITQLEINRIPIRSISISTNDLIISLKSKSNTLDFDVIPFVPEKMAKIIASFANTFGGKIIFGVKESVLNQIEVVGLNKSINVVDIVQKAIAMLSPIPNIKYEWIDVEGHNIFLIEVENRGDQEVLLNSMKYIRVGVDSILEKEHVFNTRELKKPDIKNTIAIIIAIENYAARQDNQIKKVKYAIEDARAFKQCLIDNMHIPEDNIHMFVDQEAYKSSLDYDLSGLFRYLEEDDQLIFYYAGHGFHDGITNYLSTYDTHPFNIAETSVSLRQILFDPLQESKCKNALIFIDACAQMLRKDGARNSISDINIEEFSIITDKFPNFSTFLSCHTGQKSYSCDEIEHGVWTYHLNKALSGNEVSASRSNQFITNQSLRDYLSVNVSKYVKEGLGYEQDPKAILDSNHEVVILSI